MPIDASIALDYWRAISGDDSPLPDLGETPVENFQALLLADLEPGFSAASFRSRELDPLAIYGGIALLENPSPDMLDWATGIAQLIGFTTPALQQHVWYLDEVPDADGNHRVYGFVHGEAVQELASIEDALRWMTAFINYSEQRCDQAHTQGIEAKLRKPRPWATSGPALLAELLQLPLPQLYAAWAEHTWLSYDEHRAQDLDSTGPGAARVAMLAAVENVMRSRSLDTRTVDYSQMSGPHKRVIEQLRQLTKAVSTGYAPKLVLDIARSNHPTLARRAQEWLLHFEASEQRADQELAPPVADETRALRMLIAGGLDQLVGQELIEIEPEGREPLLDELAMAVLEAYNPDHAIKKLRVAVLRSDHVAEVYAADIALEGAFRQSLGG